MNARIVGYAHVILITAPLGLATIARAQTPAPATAPAPADTRINFRKGTFTLQTEALFAQGMEERHENITSGNIGIGYFVFDNFSLNVEFSGYRVIQTGEDAWMTGISGAIHHHLFRFDRWTLFGDVDFGPVYATREVPFDGTHFNFTTRAGIGATVKLQDDLHLLLGVRYFHLSNARIEGAERNPSINGMEGYVGLMWTFN